jgi:hypothetical protein
MPVVQAPVRNFGLSDNPNDWRRRHFQIKSSLGIAKAGHSSRACHGEHKIPLTAAATRFAFRHGNVTNHNANAWL